MHLIFASSLLFLVLGMYFSKLWKGEEDLLFNKLIPLLFSELGVAGLISIILIFSIEKFSRNNHNKEAEEMHEKIYNNVFRAVYKRNMDEKIFEEVEKSLFHSDIQREKYKVFYTLDHINKDEDDKKDKPQHLSVTMKSRYTIRNISNSTVNHSIESSFELPIDETWIDQVVFKRLDISGSHSPNITLDETNLKNYVAPNDDNDQLQLNYEVAIPKDSTIDVEIEGILIKRLTDMEVWASKIPSDGIELHVYTPEDLKVCASANHSEKLTLVNTDKNMSVWELKYGLFPHQSIIFWWDKSK